MVHKFPLLLVLAGGAAAWGCGADPAPASSSVKDAAAASDAGATTDADALPDIAADATPLSLPAKKPDAALAILSYNVMCSFCMNSSHPEWDQKWEQRVPMLRDVITRLDPDLMGLQELQAIIPTKSGKPEIEELLGAETPYVWFYHHASATDAEDKDYPDALVAWKKARFDKLEDGVFWLSPTPDKAMSWGLAGKAQFPRLMVWVKLHDKQRNRDLFFASTHFDNSAPSQEKSSPIALERLGPKTQVAPLLVTGDFNSEPADKAYKLLVAGQTGVSPPWQDSFVLAKSWGIVHNQPSKPAWDPQTRIDHIFLAGAQFAVSWWGLDLWRYGEKFQAPSDHDGAMLTYVDW